jgi:hypothetical protein
MMNGSKPPPSDGPQAPSPKRERRDLGILFPLTPTLSEKGEPFAALTIRPVSLSCASKRWTKKRWLQPQGRISQRKSHASPSPWGEG